MGRQAKADYLTVAREVLQELGGGPLASRDLVAAAQERGLVGEGKWVYHNLLRKVRASDEFDTSKRGYVSLANQGAAPAAAPAPEAQDEFFQPKPTHVQEWAEGDSPDETPAANTVGGTE